MRKPAFSERDLEVARRVHRSLLPVPIAKDWVEIATRYKEATLLGGDYATVYDRTPGRIFECACDVTGHGLAAALLAGRINSFVRSALHDAEHPCQVVDSLNSFVYRRFAGLGMYPSFFCLEIDRARGEIHYAGCGHPPPLLYRADERRCVRLRSSHTLIGLFPEFPGGCQIDVAPISPGDRLLLYTDGVIETRNEAAELFGTDRLERLVVESGSETSIQLLDKVFDRLRRFRHGDRQDDALIVATRFL